MFITHPDKNRNIADKNKKFALVKFINIPFLHIYTIVVIALAVYSNTYNAPFQFDDHAYILNYLSVKNPQSVLSSIEDIKSSVITNDAFKSGMLTRPLSFLTFSINYKLNGIDVRGYHLFNILIHIANALLIYSFVRICFQIPSFRNNLTSHSNDNHISLVSGVAFFASLLFVAHPIQTQAVTYIVQRFASLTTFFYIFTLVLYVKSSVSHNLYYKRVFYLVSFFASVLAMLTKEIAFTLPVVIILFEIMFLDGSLKHKFTRCAPFFLTMGIIPYNVIKAKNILSNTAKLSDSMNAWAGNTTLSNIDYLFTEFRVIVTYLRLLFIPVNQNIDHNYPVFHSFLNPEVIASFSLLTILAFAGVYLWYKSTKQTSLDSFLFRLAAFGIFWFFITISVESSFYPIESVIYEHRVYLPSVGFFLTIVSLITLLLTRRSSVFTFKTGIIVVALLIVASYATATYMRNSVWKDSITLWEDVVKKNPTTARGHINLSAAYFKSKRFEEAENGFYIAAKLNPNNPKIYYNLGLINGEKKQFLKAIGFYRMSLQLDSKYLPAHIAIGKIYQEQGLLVEASREYIIVNTLEDDFFPAHYNLGLIYYDLGQYENAIKEYTEALRLKSDFAPLYNSMGIALFRSGAPEKAVFMIKKALQLEPDNKNAISNLQKIEARSRGKI